MSTKIILDKRRALKNGYYPVKLRVCYKRRAKFYGLGIALTENEFTKMMGKYSKGDYYIKRIKLNKKEFDAYKIIDELDPFSFKQFEDRFIDKKIISTDAFLLINEKIEELEKQKRIKTKKSYESLFSSLKKFHLKDCLPIERIKVSFLEEYELWLLDKGRSITTVGIYLRNLRAIINRAIDEEIISRDKYPFGRNKYQIPTGKNIKKALTKEEVLKIMNYDPKNEMEGYCRDLWVLSYLANGANITDIAHLTHENIQDNFLVFYRRKTQRSNRQNPKLIRVYINERIKAIIEGRGSKEIGSLYLFPILTKGMTAEEQVKKIENVIRSINHHMKSIGEVLEIPKKITTYTARHTFSTVLKRSGASIEFISESLGHTNIITTEHYLDSFDDSEKEKWSKALL